MSYNWNKFDYLISEVKEPTAAEIAAANRDVHKPDKNENHPDPNSHAARYARASQRRARIPPATKGHPKGVPGVRRDVKYDAKKNKDYVAYQKRMQDIEEKPVNAWTTYQTLGRLMSEDLGYHVEESMNIHERNKENLAKKKAVMPTLKGPKGKLPESTDASIWNLYRDMGIILAEAFAGPIASKYGEKRMKSGGTEKMRDPVVKREAQKTQANVDKKLGTKTNLRAKDAVQGAMNRRRAEARKRKEGLGGKLTSGDKRALAQRDVDLRSGDK